MVKVSIMLKSPPKCLFSIEIEISATVLTPLKLACLQPNYCQPGRVAQKEKEIHTCNWSDSNYWSSTRIHHPAPLLKFISDEHILVSHHFGPKLVLYTTNLKLALNNDVKLHKCQHSCKKPKLASWAGYRLVRCD